MQNISDAAIFADSTLSVSKSENRARSFSLDTTFVLFFLAMELGQGSFGLNAEFALSAVTISAFIALPYFLPSNVENKGLIRWLAGRSLIVLAGLIIGALFGQATGNLLPEASRFVPMSLLIVAAIICCNIQIYGILKNRLAR